MATTTIGRFMGGVVIGSGGDLFSAGDLFVDRSVLEGVDVDFEAEACYVHNAAALTSIVFALTDGTNVITKTKYVTDETLSSYTPKHYPNKTGKIVARFTGAEIASLTDVVVTLTITFTPATGTAAVVSHEFLNNAGGTRTISRIFVDQAAGNDANNGLTVGAAVATMGRGIRLAATTNNPAITDPTLVIPIVEMLSGTYSSCVQASNGDNFTWMTVKPYTGHEGNVIISCTGGAYLPRCRFFRFKGIKVNVSNGSTGSNQFLAGHAQFVDGTGKPAGVWLDDCDVYHGLGRVGQLSNNATFVNKTSITYGQWWTRGKYSNMNQAASKEFRFVRDILIDTVSGDALKDAQVICEAVINDNSPDPTVLTVTSVTGATVGGIVYGTTSTQQATITEVRATGNSLVISGATNYAFKPDDNVTNGMQFYAAGQTPGVDSPAATTKYSPLHADLFQLNNGAAIDNAVYSNWMATFCENQLLFPNRNGDNLLFRNIAAANSANTVTVSTSQFGDGSNIVTKDHVVYENCTIPNQELQPRHIVTNCKAIHCVFDDFLSPFPTTDGTASGLTIEECHATSPAARYTSSRGAPLLVAAPAYNEDATALLDDFSPATGSPLLNRITTGNRQHKYYADGTEIPNDGMGAIGAYGLAVDPPGGLLDYSDLIPANLKPGLLTQDGLNLKPGLTTSLYSGGTPTAANQVKSSLLNADGTLKPGLTTADGSALKPSLKR
jgi:hypothetical protein